MVPALLVSFTAAELAGAAFQAALGLAANESLAEAGAPGVLAALLLALLLVVPQLAGVALGVRARRLGERLLGTIGIAVNTAIAAFLILVTPVDLALA